MGATLATKASPLPLYEESGPGSGGNPSPSGNVASEESVEPIRYAAPVPSTAMPDPKSWFPAPPM